MDEGRLLRAVLDAPEDDAPRLRFADWLSAGGRADRAEFIRLQIELARLEDAAEAGAGPTEEEERLEARIEELLDEHAWHLGFPEIPGIDWGGGPHHGFERGFMARLTAEGAGAFRSRMGEAFAVAPIAEVKIDGADDDALAAVALSPHLGRLRGLRLTYGEVGDAGAMALAASPHAAGLRMLCFFACKVGPAGAAALAGSPHLAGLRELTLNACPIGEEGARAVLGSSTLASLELVDLRGGFPRAKHKGLVASLRARFGAGLEV
jgi:uncharacterized protein (TIGR02996 family)